MGAEHWSWEPSPLHYIPSRLYSRLYYNLEYYIIIFKIIFVRQVCEKYLANGKDVFWAFMNLEKDDDTIDRQGMWQMLRVYGVGGKLLEAVQSFYVDSRACVRVGNDVSEWFPVNVD